VTPIRRTLAVALLAVLAGAGCVPQGPNLAPWLYEDPVTAPDQAHVIVVGDSLSAQADVAGAKEAWKSTGDALSYQAFGGTQWQHWSERFAQVPAGATVEVLLGTNDVGNLTLQQAEWNVLAALNILDDQRPACVVTFLLNETSASYRPPELRAKILGFNAWLIELAASGTYPWLGLYDWRADSAGHPEYLVEDHVHHTDAGNEAYIEAQLSGPSACPAGGA
jgi:hypothetical protein